MNRQSARLVWIVCLAALMTCEPASPSVAPAPGQYSPPSDGAIAAENAFLEILARDT